MRVIGIVLFILAIIAWCNIVEMLP